MGLRFAAGFASVLTWLFVAAAIAPAGLATFHTGEPVSFGITMPSTSFRFLSHCSSFD